MVNGFIALELFESRPEGQTTLGQKLEIVENEENLNFVISLSKKVSKLNSTHSIL